MALKVTNPTGYDGQLRFKGDPEEYVVKPRETRVFEGKVAADLFYAQGRLVVAEVVDSEKKTVSTAATATKKTSTPKVEDPVVVEPAQTTVTEKASEKEGE